MIWLIAERHWLIVTWRKWHHSGKSAIVELMIFEVYVMAAELGYVRSNAEVLTRPTAWWISARRSMTSGKRCGWTSAKLQNQPQTREPQKANSRCTAAYANYETGLERKQQEKMDTTVWGMEPSYFSCETDSRVSISRCEFFYTPVRKTDTEETQRRAGEETMKETSDVDDTFSTDVSALHRRNKKWWSRNR